MNPDPPNCPQYCLKWNNHKNNISGVFDRLRLDERFVDVTLASADQKSIRCHRILLSAGSGYLEEILSQNPSDHPTIVLSEIYYKELKHLVDFMYAGEVAVEQSNLNNLLEAAKVLKIKGLWESGLDSNKDESEEEEEGEIIPVPEITGVYNEPKEPLVSPSMPELKSPPSISSLKTMMQVVGSKRRKRSRNGDSVDSEITNKERPSKKIVKKDVVTNSGTTTPGKVYSPLFGVSNAYFLTQPPPLKTIMENAASISKPIVEESKSNSSSSPSSPALSDNLIKDIPNFLTQNPVHPTIISSGNSGGNKLPLFLPGMNDSVGSNNSGNQSDGDGSVKSNSSQMFLLGSTPIRRYKQYTEDTLQSALKEIMEGQSINRSSMKYNIPARTLRDWMKRLNIKSVFTHHSHQKDERGCSLDSNPDEWNETKPNSEGSCDENKVNGTAFPGMLNLSLPFSSGNKSGRDDDDEEEEEIDDDEEKMLEVASG